MAIIIGTNGNDVLSGTTEDDVIIGRDGNDSLAGGNGNDVLIGGDGNDNLSSLGGRDVLIGGDGNDNFDIFALEAFDGSVVNGGDGSFDHFLFFGGLSVVDLEAGVLQGTTLGGEAGTLKVTGIESFQHIGPGDAVISGNAAANFLLGSDGNDTINGRAGNDSLNGGGGDNLFVFDRVGAADADLVDFVKSEQANVHDRLALDSSVMTELGATGDFAADDGRFFAAAGATGGAEADDRVVYDTNSGNLYYDADGSGAGEAQLIATIFPLAEQLAAGDITVI